MAYNELLNDRQRKCPIFHDVRNTINEFHQMNEAFYTSLSATQVYESRFFINKNRNFPSYFSELKADEDNHWQQRSSLSEKQSKLKSELNELEQVIILFYMIFKYTSSF
jgi:hypothetical protein